jgi:hypothetical protein
MFLICSRSGSRGAGVIAYGCQIALIPLRDLLPFRFAKRAKAIVIDDFARLHLCKWEKVPKGDEGTLADVFDSDENRN